MNLLKNLHSSAEELQGKRLLSVLGAVFIVFLIIGISINYFTQEVLNNNELKNKNSTQEKKIVEDAMEEGTVVYIDPRFYPNDNISYYLADNTGQEIILLKAKDQKLEVAEGLYVKVYGKRAKTIDGNKEVLIVERVAVKSK